jgi:HEAT repeat protein
VRRLRVLARDRDRTVRARAIAALGIADPGHRLRAIDDPAPEVRAASVVGASESDLRTLAADRDPEVRAAALAALGDRVPELATRAASDLSAAVRIAAIGSISDDDLLARLASDASPEVATAALVKLVMRRGRAVMTGPLLTAFVDSPANGPERVRIALAWLLAR